MREVPGLLGSVVSKKVGRCKYRRWTQESSLGGKSKAMWTLTPALSRRERE
jgi:hypothetical protein